MTILEKVKSDMIYYDNLIKTSRGDIKTNALATWCALEDLEHSIQDDELNKDEGKPEDRYHR